MLVNLVLRAAQADAGLEHARRDHASRARSARGSASSSSPTEIGPQDIAFLQYTGGTTGVAKAAVLTHRNMVANVLQASAWIRPALQPGPQRIIITALPLYHIFSLTANCLLFARLGAKNVLITNPRDFPRFVARAAQAQVLLHQRRQHAVQCAACTRPASSRSTSPRSRSRSAAEWRYRPWSRRAGRKSRATCSRRPGDSPRPRPPRASTPWASTSTDRSVCRSPRRTSPSATTPAWRWRTNEVGEICVFGPQLMRGYWNRPDETEKVMFGDWLRTGDIGRMDDKGFVYIEDRKKDMILVSGFNVYPNEIESVVAEHPGVLEVAAVAQPDENSGRVGGAVRREEGPEPHRRGADRVSAARTSRATRCRSTCTSAASCRRPTSARSCGARCATSCAGQTPALRARRRRRRSGPGASTG